MSKPKISLTHLSQPIESTDSLLLSAASSKSTPSEESVPEQEAKVRFTNALPAATFQRLQQYAFWAHETLGEVLDEALQAYLATKPEADRALPQKQAAKKRRKRSA
jgi:hypothetical protein